MAFGNRFSRQPALRGELPVTLDDAYAWRILLGRDRTVNAFALPGAYFGLHLGLVGTVSSRDELASVLAHELSHVTQRHIARLISRQSAQAPWLIGAMILGAMAASKNPSAANAVIVGGQAVAAQTQLNFSRDMEREADRVGFGIAGQAGFAPQGFVSMFEKLQQSSRLNDGWWFSLLAQPPAEFGPHGGHAGAHTADQCGSSSRTIGRVRVDCRPCTRVIQPCRRCPTGVGGASKTLLHLPSCLRHQQALKLCTEPPWLPPGCATMKPSPSLLDRLQALVHGDAAALRQVQYLRGEIALARGQAAQALLALGPVVATNAGPNCCCERRRKFRLGNRVRQRKACKLGPPTTGTMRWPGSGWRARWPTKVGPWPRCAQRRRRMWPSWTTTRRWPGSRPRRSWRALRRRRTTSRRRLWTPAVARSSSYFGNRRSSADSMTKPSTV